MNRQPPPPLLDPGRPKFKIGDFVWVAPKGVYVFNQPKRISGFAMTA